MSDDNELWGCVAAFAPIDVNNFIQNMWYPDKTSLSDYSVTLRALNTSLLRDLLLYGRINSAPPSAGWNAVDGYNCKFQTESCLWDTECTGGSTLVLSRRGTRLATTDIT